MMYHGVITRLGCAVCLTAALIVCGLGCQQASSGSGRGSTPTKPTKPPDNKDQPGKPPKPDVS